MFGMFLAASRKLPSSSAAADEQGVRQAELVEGSGQRLRLGSFGSREVVDDDQVLRAKLGRQRVAQAERAHLLRKVVLVAAHDRAVRLAAAAELRDARGRMAGAAGALLPVHLRAGAGDLRRGRATCGVPCCFFASCQRTTRARMSSRGSRPKIASERETLPASLPSSVVTVRSIIRLPRSKLLPEPPARPSP